MEGVYALKELYFQPGRVYCQCGASYGGWEHNVHYNQYTNNESECLSKITRIGPHPCRFGYLAFVFVANFNFRQSTDGWMWHYFKVNVNLFHVNKLIGENVIFIPLPSSKNN